MRTLERQTTFAEANEVKIFTRKQYEVQPQDKYNGETFRLLVGTDHYPTRILEDHEVAGEDYSENATIENVPTEYYYDFVNDPENALRDIVGISTDVITPFISQRHKVVEAIVNWRSSGSKIWVDKQNVDLSIDGMPQIIEENLPEDKDTPRFVHIDLALTGSGTGDSRTC